MHRVRITLLICFGALVAAGILGATTESAWATNPATAATGKHAVITAPTKSIYTVHGQALSLRCAGKGRFPVVFLAGGNDPGAYWDGLIAKLGPKVLTCVFDRPGVGASTVSPKPMTPKSIGDGLSAALKQAHVGKRIVLVGHSIGGAVALVYGADHPKAVAGAVLVDPSESKFFQITNSEAVLEAFNYAPQATEAQISAVKRWPSVPLEVLSRDPKRAVADGNATEAQEAVWATIARKYAQLSTKGKRTVVPNATHYVYFDAPDLTAAAIKGVLGAAK